LHTLLPKHTFWLMEGNRSRPAFTGTART
jgi:hypothetical protein